MMTCFGAVHNNNNNNDYLERLTRTGPKRLHVLYKLTLSKVNAYNMNAHTHTHTHAHTHRLADIDEFRIRICSFQ